MKSFLKRLFYKHDYNYEYLHMVNGDMEKTIPLYLQEMWESEV